MCADVRLTIPSPYLTILYTKSGCFHASKFHASKASLPQTVHHMHTALLVLHLTLQHLAGLSPQGGSMLQVCGESHQVP